jgi:hypothetical protein
MVSAESPATPPHASSVRARPRPRTRRPLAGVAAGVIAATACAACEGNGPMDAVIDLGTDSAVWSADAEQVGAALPQSVASFKASDAPSPFHTSYRTGPVFGASRTYHDGPRELVVRVEAGNIRERAAALARGHANPGTTFATREASVHEERASVHWDATGKAAEVVLVLRRRYVLDLHLTLASSDDEAVQLAGAMDVQPIRALALAGLR